MKNFTNSPTQAAYPVSRGLAVLSKVAVVSAFLMVFAGSLITSNKAALSDPTWPTFNGHLYPKYWVGGLIYEDSHRVKGMVLGIIMMWLTTWISLRDPRSGVRKLGWFAMVLVLVQGLIGGLIIKTYRNVGVSMLHASTAQLFFLTVVSIALLQSKSWLRILGMAAVPAAASIRKLAPWALALVYCQVVLGSGVRHSEKLFLPYVLIHATVGTGATVLIFALWLKARKHLADVRELYLPIAAAGYVVLMQFSLGFPAILSNRNRLEQDSPHLLEVAVSSLHVLGAASLLGLLITLNVRLRHILAARPSEVSATLSQPSVAAGDLPEAARI